MMFKWIIGISIAEDDEYTYIMMYRRWCLTAHFSPFSILLIITWFWLFLYMIHYHDLYYICVMCQENILKDIKVTEWFYLWSRPKIIMSE